jgi:4-alpha-glucanotransferase
VSARAAGILLHPTSLPGPHGIGDLGPGARRFLGFLADAGLSLWQVLPLHPTGYGDSPYAPLSAFAGNPLLVSLEILAEAGDLPRKRIASPPFDPAARRTDFAAVRRWKLPRLEEAARRFLRRPGGRRDAFEAFSAAAAAWLEDYVLFADIKESLESRPGGSGAWYAGWPADLAARDPGALARWRSDRREELDVRRVQQFFFHEQWQALHQEAARQGVSIIGDMPIFVAGDSAEVWANRRLFRLDASGSPLVVAGVPPDYFSPTGQRWGNPLYDWDALAREGYRWWIERVRAALRMVDWLRIDHFRGFAACWEVPADSPTAERGRWVPAPGDRLFDALHAALGPLPIVAEDLGVITPEVERLRDGRGFPGMKILQFAFDAREAGPFDPDNPFLPHNFAPNAVVYTGTHDNDTTRGWWRQRNRAERDAVRSYLGLGGRARPRTVVWAFIRLALSSVCRFAILPLQDVLVLGSGARMNTPSTFGGNWTWRCRDRDLSPRAAARLAGLARSYGRHP